MDTPFFQLTWQQLHHPVLASTKTELWICQLECAVPAAAGNKWLKLKYHISKLQQYNLTGIITFGGAFSNHLAAVAAAGHQFGFATQGFVRSAELDEHNPTLRQCKEFGMKLIPLDFSNYRRRHDPDFLNELKRSYPNWLIVPEGGSSALAVEGFADTNFANTPNGFAEFICCAAASGGTTAGIVQQQNQQAKPSRVLAVSVVKDNSLSAKIAELCPGMDQAWQLVPDISQRRYGRFDQSTLDFCFEMSKQGISLEPIYTGKALRTLLQHLVTSPELHGKRGCFFHTGGLQGLEGLRYRKLISEGDYQQLKPKLPALSV